MPACTGSVVGLTGPTQKIDGALSQCRDIWANGPTACARQLGRGVWLIGKAFGERFGAEQYQFSPGCPRAVLTQIILNGDCKVVTSSSGGIL